MAKDNEILVTTTPGFEGRRIVDYKGLVGGDAILGAVGMGDIGEHFPDTDPKYKDVDSIRLLEIVAKMAVDNNFEIGNVDCSVVCEQPKIAPHRDEMQKILSLAAGAPVTVKGRRAEGLGAIGRVEGIACWAVAIVTQTK